MNGIDFLNKVRSKRGILFINFSKRTTQNGIEDQQFGTEGVIWDLIEE